MTPSQKLGANIRFYRKLKKLTQSELADMLFVTPQSLSKWEIGLANPDVWNLYRLSEIFGISCDLLLGRQEKTEEKLMLAVDGGGSKTEFIMFNNNGEILSRTVYGTSNPNICGFEKALACLKNGISEMLAENGNIFSIYLGIAGCGLTENRKNMQNALKLAFQNISIEVQSDIYNVVYTNEISEEYVSVICGTGSSVCIKKPDGIRRIGGYGYLIDKTYSGFLLGKEAISAALAFRDGLAEESLLTHEVEKLLNGKASEMLSKIYSSGNDYIASFSRVVFHACDMGDKTAKNIIEISVKELSKQINHAARMIDGKKNVTLSGGLTYRSDILIPLLEKYCPDILFSITDMPQIYGAAIYCAKRNGIYDLDFKNNLKSNYIKITEAD